MSEEYRSQVYNNLDLKSTEELLEIWKKNERFEWSDTAFEVIQEILEERLEELPPQNEPVHEQVEEKKEKQVLSEKYTDADNNGLLYDPKKVLKLCSWLNWMSVIFPFLIVLLNFNIIIQILFFFSPYFFTNTITQANSLLAIIVNILYKSIPYFLLFRAISYLLKTLLEMEINSREVREEG